jgi:membrane protein required for colicin V production
MIIDIAVAIVLLISAGISFLRGLIREIFTIAGVVGGALAAIFFGPSLAGIFRSWFGIVEGEPPEKLFDLIPMNFVADGLAYAAIFIAFVIIISVFSQFFSAAIKAAGLGPIDRTLGVIFGLLRGVLLMALLYLPFHLLMDEQSKTKYFAESKTHIYIEKSAGFIAKYLPSSKDVEDKINEVEETQIKKKLFENNILSDGTEKKQTEQAAEKPVEEIKPETGYDQEDRQDIKDLFRQPTYNE